MSKFLLLLHDPVDSPFLSMSPAEMQAVIERYTAWSAQLAAEGRIAGGNKLQDGTARHVSKLGVIDGPYPETKEIIGGYFLIEAASYDEAVEIALSCPHVDLGRIEVREVELT
ncbi:MAG: transcription initiation protein [Acidobacteriaceae bacterium]|nr:transcription initiation protein [Acidobacteriaceae bacterium]